VSSVAQDRQPGDRAGSPVEPLPGAVAASAALRRTPVQQRSAERVDRMLDACAALLDEHGYDKLTTTLIARRADVAIGSVYQFFGDKRAVVRALSLRHLEGFSTRVTAHIAENEPQHWWDLVGTVIDEYIDMHRTVPGFRTLHFGDAVDEHLMDESRTNNGVLAARLLELLEERFDVTGPRARLELALTIAVEAGDALVKLAFRNNPDGDDVILTEVKTLIRDYLAQHVQPAR
jgi:AcrR family transcriptional regulator